MRVLRLDSVSYTLKDSYNHYHFQIEVVAIKAVLEMLQCVGLSYVIRYVMTIYYLFNINKIPKCYKDCNKWLTKFMYRASKIKKNGYEHQLVKGIRKPSCYSRMC